VADLSEDERAARKAARQAARAGKSASTAAPASPDDAAPPADGEAKTSRKQAKKRKGPVREWVDSIVWALVVMFVVRTFLVDNFRIPTPSMEKTLLVGDFLFVSKNHYGIRLPMSVSVPFTKIYVPGLNLPYVRFPGFSEVQRGEAVVFNWPGMPSEPITLPVDKRDHYIKRCIAVAGDSVAVGTPVTLFYSTGPSDRFERVPNVVGLTVAEARATLLRNRLRALVMDAQGNADPQVVRRQGREPGTSVRGGYEVRLYVKEDTTQAAEPLPEGEVQ